MNKVDESGSRALRRKRVARRFLVARDRAGLEKWAGAERNPLRTLASLLFDDDELIRHRAVEALGRVAALQYGEDPERVRRAIRRILWLMNDESGGICWNGPQAIGEILYNVPALLNEYGRLLPSFFGESPFEKGARLAVARAASVDPAVFQEAVDPLLVSLQDADAEMRGLSLLALRALGKCDEIRKRVALRNDAGTLRLYHFESGTMLETTVAALAERCE